jgi:hypothetical protein
MSAASVCAVDRSPLRHRPLIALIGNGEARDDENQGECGADAGW